MSAKIEYKEKEIRVYLSGEIDHHSASLIRASIDDAIIHKHPSLLILDFSAVTFMDSSGIGVIIGRYKKISNEGGKVSVVNVNDRVKKIFNLSGMNKIINICDTYEEVVSSL